VDNPVKNPIIGILGGIASGKSTVAAEFARLGCKVIDADKIAKELLDEPNIKEKIVYVFGSDILGSAGEIDHKKLAALVFADADRLSTLNSIVHPVVLARAEQLIERYEGQDRVKAIVLDMPLLAEVGWAKRCERLVFVDCRLQLRAVRAKKMGIFDEKQLAARENFQISLDRKAALADNTIDNNSGLSDLARQVAEVFSCIMRGE
jgi:dephospho-CoA kinase